MKVDNGKYCFSGILIAILFIVLATITSGCCTLSKVLPFVKCGAGSGGRKVVLRFEPQTDSNRGRPVQVKVFTLTKRESFDSAPTRTLFGVDDNTTCQSIGGLQVLSTFLRPSAPDSLVVELKAGATGEVPSFLGIIADFSAPESEVSSRVLVDLVARAKVRKINIKVNAGAIVEQIP